MRSQKAKTKARKGIKMSVKPSNSTITVQYQLSDRLARELALEHRDNVCREAEVDVFFRDIPHYLARLLVDRSGRVLWRVAGTRRIDGVGRVFVSENPDRAFVREFGPCDTNGVISILADAVSWSENAGEIMVPPQ